MTIICLAFTICGKSQSMDCSITCYSPGTVNVCSPQQLNNCDSICKNQTVTYCTPAYSGASYAWFVNGGTGIQIVSGASSNCVTINVAQPGTYTLSMLKVAPGYPIPCCNYITIYVCDCSGGGGIQLPCPNLKIVTNPTIPVWDPNCPNGCVNNHRIRLDVVCDNGTPEGLSLTNWIQQNNLTGTVRWEILDGHFRFQTQTNSIPCGSDQCGYRCQDNQILSPHYLQSGYLCHCSLYPFWENMSARATVTFMQGSTVVYQTTLVDGIHFTEEEANCHGKGGRIVTNAFNQSFKIYPNPTNGNSFVEFDISEPGNVSVELFDVSGKVSKVIKSSAFLKEGKYKYEISFNGLRDKIYILAVKVNDGIIKREKIVRN